MPAQAQKHVTVNEALFRIDVFAKLRVLSKNQYYPPNEDMPGMSFIVPSLAQREWQGKGGLIATFINGGWVYTAPKVGWSAWVEDTNCISLFDGVDWISGAAVTSRGGAATTFQINEFQHTVTEGALNFTNDVIPARAIVYGVTGRVVSAVSGPGVQAWRLGVEGSEDRYGASIGRMPGAVVEGMTSFPMAYWEPSRLMISAEGGTFTTGQILLAVHYVQLRPPRSAL